MGTRLSALFPGEVVTVEADPAAVEDPLYPEEEPLVARAVDKRRREFAAGRACARRGFAELGVPAQPLLQGDDRAPIWPPGLIGTITHTRGYCGVAVARRGRLLSLGVDAEPAGAVRPELWPRICTDRELAFLDARPPSERGLLAKQLFSIKECFYKCQYPLTLEYLGFREVEVEVDLDASAFTVTLERDVGRLPRGSRHRGNFRRVDGLILSAMCFVAEET